MSRHGRNAQASADLETAFLGQRGRAGSLHCNILSRSAETPSVLGLVNPDTFTDALGRYVVADRLDNPGAVTVRNHESVVE